MHHLTTETELLAQRVLDLAMQRRRLGAPPLGGCASVEDLARLAGQTVTPDGLGAEEALRRWVEALAPATVAADHPRYLSFIPHAPTEVSVVFDLLVSASGIYGGSWLEAAGAVFAENQALRWLADLAGFGPEAGGCFVQGGTLGNLSALHAARSAALHRRRGERPPRWKLAASAEAHSSVAVAARVMDIDVVKVPGDERAHLTGPILRAAFDEMEDDGLFAVVASAGTTNLGLIDDLAGIAAVCAERGLWCHVDGAYGLAALAAPSKRAAFAGIEAADSFIVDPHKWLFAPYDCCALVYRNPGLARGAHTQAAAYLEVINQRDEWNPADYAVHLSRRARGLPFWFSLAAHGTRAYGDAVETTLAVTRRAADAIRARPRLELLVEPELTILVFRRLGWSPADYHAWSARLIAEGTAFVVPTLVRGETVVRLCILNPRTTSADVERVLDTMA